MFWSTSIIKVTFLKIKINKIEVYWSTKKDVGRNFLTLMCLILCLGKIPSVIGSLTSLKELDLAYNSLTGIKSSFSSFFN